MRKGASLIAERIRDWEDQLPINIALKSWLLITALGVSTPGERQNRADGWQRKLLFGRI
jgi:hypothetical protein